MSGPTMPDMAQSYRGTKLHAMRVPDEVWAAARARADEDGETVNGQVVAFLRAYGAGEKFTLPPRRSAAP